MLAWFAPSSALAECQTLKAKAAVHRTADPQLADLEVEASEFTAFHNFDEKIRRLEDYSVTFVEPGQKMKPALAKKSSASTAERSGLSVKLLPAHKPAKMPDLAKN